jgi:Cu(I)/Ag(I) efflux system membrane fusion protein
MYLNAAIHAGLGQKLAVPEAAVLNTGTRQLVFVQTAPGQFDPRTIEIGRQGEGYIEVRSGLKEGEMVSTAANFLIDSESKLKAAVQAQ